MYILYLFLSAIHPHLGENKFFQTGRYRKRLPEHEHKGEMS